MKIQRQLEQLLELRKLRIEIAEGALARQARARDESERQLAAADRRAAQHEDSWAQYENAWFAELTSSPADHAAWEMMKHAMASMAEEANALRAATFDAQGRLTANVEDFAIKSNSLRQKRRDCARLGVLTDRQQQRQRRQLEARAEQDEEEFAARRHCPAGNSL